MQTTQERTNLERVQALYAAFGRGDVDAILACLAPSIEWSNAGPSDLDYFGTRHGREQVAEVFVILARDFDISEFTPLRFFSSEDDVAVLLRLQATVKDTGKQIWQELVHVLTFGPDGLVTRMRDIQDSATIAAALRP
jgi:ketosteroid isomerase-like protein